MTKEQLGSLIMDSKDSLYRVAKSILKNDADCEDAVSEAIVRSFASLASLKKDIYARTWLTRILINECYRILKLRRRESGYDESVNLQESYEHEYSEIYQSIMKLDFAYRITIVLYYIEGYTIREIAAMTDTSEGTIKSRLSRGRRQLRKIYEEEGGIDETTGLAER